MIQHRSESIRKFWEKSKAEAKIESDSYHACTLSDPEALDPDVESLDLSGQPRLIGARQKRGTAHLLMDFEKSNVPRREVGDYWIILNDDLSPMYLVRLTEVTVTPFNRVPETWAAVEGEGDSSLEWWRDAHWEYYTRQCRKWGVPWRDDYPIVCETWEVISDPKGI